MAENTVEFELVSPAKLLRSEQVDMVVVPGAEGNFGVLPGHTPMISTVRPGIIDVYEGGTVRDQIFVGGGFAEVTGERCTVLADDAVAVKEIDRAALETEIKELREDIGDAKSDDERATLEKSLMIAEAKLAAAASSS